MRRLFAGRARRSRGQALVEFALVIPFFLMLLFGIVDLGRYVYSTNALSQAVREAGRAGSVAYWPPDCNGISARLLCIQTIARNRSIAVPISTSDVNVTCKRLGDGGVLVSCLGTWVADDRLTVSVAKDLHLVTPIIGQFIGSVRMTASTTVTLD